MAKKKPSAPRIEKPEVLLRRLLRNPKGAATNGDIAAVLKLVIDSDAANSEAARSARSSADAALYVANYCR